MAVAERRTRDIEVSEVVYEDVRPKRLKLVVPTKTLGNHLDQLESVDSSEFRTRVLLEVRQFYPLKAVDVELLCSRLIAAHSIPGLQDEIKTLCLEVLRKVLSCSWFPSDSFPFEKFAELMLTQIAKESSEEVVSSWLQILLEFIEKLAIESDVLSDVRDAALKLLNSQFWRTRYMSLNILTKVEHKLEQFLALERKQSMPSTSKGFVSGLSNAGPLSPSFKRVSSNVLKVFKDKSPAGDASSEKSSTSSPKAGSSASNISATPSSIENVGIEKILITYASDMDARVRMNAVELLWHLHENNHQLNVESYSTICSLLSDSEDCVRVGVLRLVWLFAKLFSENSVVGPHEGVELRLIDDAFSKLCNAMQDVSMFVRKTAAQYLGTLTSVSEKFLEQTLDKKLMSKMKFLRAGIQRPRDYSEWATGRRFGADSPAEKIEEDSNSIIPSGACGAFVTGLEDEYMVVREASIDAVCKLAESCPKFASLCLDFLADMFNDEIAEVRLRAINSLRRICQHIVLKEEQTEIILNALDDASSDSREAVRELLSVCSLFSIQCMQMTVDALLSNLKRYPGDQLSIWRCFKHLGLNHYATVSMVVSDLLKLHPFFDVSEPDIDDPAYIGLLIFVINGSYRYPVIQAQFRSHIWKHYEYLRHSMPHLVPNLKADEDYSKDTANGEALKKQLLELLDGTKQRIARSIRLSGPSKVTLLEFVLKELRRLRDLKAEVLDAESHFLCLFIESHLQLEKIAVRTGVITGGVPDMQMELQSIFEVLKNSLRLEALFRGLDPVVLNAVHDLRLRSSVVLLTRDPSTLPLFRSFLNSASFVSASHPSQLLLKLLCIVNDKFVEQSVSDNTFSLLATLRDTPYVLPFEIALEEQQPSALPLSILTTTSSAASSDVKRRLCAEVKCPPQHSETVVKFTAGLTVGVEFEALFREFPVEMIERIRIEILYPDQTIDLFRPRLSEFREISEGLLRLRTKVLLNHSIWSETSTVELRIGLALPEAISQLKSKSTSCDSNLAQQRAENNLHCLEFTEPVFVKVLPKSKC